MTLYVLDASAVLAYLWRESGWDVVEQVLLAGEPMISTINISEVAGKVLQRGFAESDGHQLLDNLGLVPVDFDSEQAWRAALLQGPTRSLGLSLGDRACLALAQSRNIKALTADKTWLGLSVGIHVECIR